LRLFEHKRMSVLLAADNHFDPEAADMSHRWPRLQLLFPNARHNQVGLLEMAAQSRSQFTLAERPIRPARLHQSFVHFTQNSIRQYG